MNWTALCAMQRLHFLKGLQLPIARLMWFNHKYVHTIFIAKIAICSPNFIQIGRDCKTVLNDAFEFSVKKFKNKISFCKYE